MLLTKEFLNQYRDKQPAFGYNGLGYIVYQRTYARIKEDGTKENWIETLERCINGAQKIGAGYTQEEAERLFDYMFNLKCSFGGRMLWQLGTATATKGDSLNNCYFVAIRSPKDFCFLFDQLMLGGY